MFNTFIEDKMDEIIQSYTGTEVYKTRQSELNKMIATFRSNLTSESQRAEFNQLMNLLSNDHADYNVETNNLAFRAGMAFQAQSQGN